MKLNKIYQIKGNHDSCMVSPLPPLKDGDPSRINIGSVTIDATERHMFVQVLAKVLDAVTNEANDAQ